MAHPCGLELSVNELCRLLVKRQYSEMKGGLVLAATVFGQLLAAHVTELEDMSGALLIRKERN